MNIKPIILVAATVSFMSQTFAAAPSSAPGGPSEENAFVKPALDPVPSAWKWISSDKVIFSYDRTYEDSTAFVFDGSRLNRKVRST